MLKFLKSNRITILKILAAFLFPAVLCICYCLFRGVSISDLYVPNSHNNDSLLYYKQIDGILKSGLPRGFYGYNESRAPIGTLGAWVPSLYIPWVIWGLCAGWTYTSSLVFNVVLMSVAMALFAALTDIDFKKLAIIFVAFLIYPSVPVHLLNVLPEAMVISLGIVYLAIAIRCCNKGASTAGIFWLWVIAAFLTIGRPYMIIFMFLPCFFSIKRNVKRGIIGSLIIIAVSLFGYFWLSKYMTGKYYEPAFRLDFLDKIKEGYWEEAAWILYYQIKGILKGIGDFLKDAFSYGFSAGVNYFIAMLAIPILTVKFFDKRNSKIRPVIGFISVGTLAMLAAIVFLLQKTNEGGRHILLWAILGIMTCAYGEWSKKDAVLSGIIIAFLIVFVARGSMRPTDYGLPIRQQHTVESVEYWKGIADQGLIEVSDTTGYENTIIWAFIDYVDGNQIVMDFSGLFSMPADAGINCCFPDYLINNFDNLKSRYIMADSRGKVAAFCAEKGLKVVGEHENVIMYQRY